MRPPLASIAALAAALATSCWSPAFDPELSLAMATVSKMEKVGTVDVTGVYEPDLGTGYFIPRRVATPTDGLWISGWGDVDEPYEWASPAYMASMAISEILSTGQSSFSPPRSDFPALSMSPAGTIEAAAITRKSSSYWGLSELYPTGTADAGPIGIDSSAEDFAGSGEFYGAGFTAENAAGDRGCAVFEDGSIGACLLVEIAYSGDMPIVEATIEVTLPAGSYPSVAGFAARLGDLYFLSFTDADGNDRTIRWNVDESEAPEELMVGEALVGALRDGTLLSSDGMTTTARDSDGEALYSFPTGSLKFAHERYDPTLARWIAVFVRTMFVPNGGRGYGTLRSEIYEVPSSDLIRLAK